MNGLTEAEKDAIRKTKEYQEAKTLIGNLLTNVLYVSSKIGILPTPYEIFNRNCLEFYKKWKETEGISVILRDLKSEVTYPNDKLKSMGQMLAYLGLAETVGVTLIDMALILLIANGKEVHTRRPHTKHVVSFEELEDIPLGYKLKFLKTEKLDSIKDIVDVGLRNIIAHLKFTIDDNGTIRDRGNNQIHINAKISEFWTNVDRVMLIFEDLDFLKRLEAMSIVAKMKVQSLLIVGKEEGGRQPET